MTKNFDINSNVPFISQQRTVLTATGLVNGEWQILTPYRIETPKPIDKKFGTGCRLPDIITCAKIFVDRLRGFDSVGVQNLPFSID